VDDRSNPEEDTLSARSQLSKEDLKNATCDANDISESFDSCPYYLSEDTKCALLSTAYLHLQRKDYIKFTKHISSLSQRALLSGPAGITVHLVKAWYCIAALLI
jgi:hypothetical protein